MVQTKKIVFTLIFLACLVAQLLPVIRSGTFITNGIGFWGPNGHDGVWHLALINHINNPFVINMPIFSGETLKNYHPFFDIIIAYASKISHISSSLLLFQVFPLISTFLYLLLSFKIGKILTQSDKGGVILMILNTINNSFGWIISFFRSKSFEGESLFWGMQSPSNQLNPPFALSLVLLLLLIYILISSQKKLIQLGSLYISLILIFLPIIKAYSAIPAYIIFFFYTIKTKSYFKTLFFSTLIASLLFLQFNKNAGSLLVFHPLWFINSLFESADKLYIPRFANLAQTSGIKLLIFYAIGIPIFIIGNFSFRLLGLKQLFDKSWFLRAIFISSLILTLTPLLFIQSGTSWNTIQFLYYSLFLLNIPLAVYLSKSKFFITLFIITIQLIPLFASFPQYVGKIPPAYLSNQEKICLDYLKKQPPSIILTYPYDAYKKTKMTAPIPLYAYETTSYVSAYSNQLTYLADEMNLANSGYDWSSRRLASEAFFKQTNKFQDRGFLLNNGIDYIYLVESQRDDTRLDTKGLYIQSVFENSVCQIYKVIK